MPWHWCAALMLGMLTGQEGIYAVPVSNLYCLLMFPSPVAHSACSCYSLACRLPWPMPVYQLLSCLLPTFDLSPDILLFAPCHHSIAILFLWPFGVAILRATTWCQLATKQPGVGAVATCLYLYYISQATDWHLGCHVLGVKRTPALCLCIKMHVLPLWKLLEVRGRDYR